MPSWLGFPELILILVILLVIFGPKRLPEIGRSVGKGIKEFRKSTTELQEQLTSEDDSGAKTETTETSAKPAEGTESKKAESTSS